MNKSHGPGRRRFSYDQAMTIMREYNAGGITVRALADKHDVHWSVMQSLVTGRTYNDIWLTLKREQGSLVDWAEPPPRKQPGPANTSGIVLDELTALLKAHPGRWAHVRTSPNRPNLTWMHRRGLQAEMRKMDDGWRTYARWPVEGLLNTTP